MGIIKNVEFYHTFWDPNETAFDGAAALNVALSAGLYQGSQILSNLV